MGVFGRFTRYEPRLIEDFRSVLNRMLDLAGEHGVPVILLERAPLGIRPVFDMLVRARTRPVVHVSTPKILRSHLPPQRHLAEFNQQLPNWTDEFARLPNIPHGSLHPYYLDVWHLNRWAYRRVA